MVVLIFAGNSKMDYNFVEEWRIICSRAAGSEVCPDMEYKFIGASSKTVAAEQWLVTASIAIGNTCGEQITTAVSPSELNFNAAARAAVGGVQHVGG